MDHEARSDYNAVWIITPDVYTYFLKPEAKERFETNIQNNVTYRYFIREPSHFDSVSDLKQLKTRAAEVPDNLAVKSFSEKEFNTESATDYIIMNANSDSKHPLWVFLKLPVKQAGAEYWIRVEDEAAEHFVGRFTKMWESKIEQESAAGRGTGT